MRDSGVNVCTDWQRSRTILTIPLFGRRRQQRLRMHLIGLLNHLQLLRRHHWAAQSLPGKSWGKAASSCRKRTPPGSHARSRGRGARQRCSIGLTRADRVSRLATNRFSGRAQASMINATHRVIGCFIVLVQKFLGSVVIGGLLHLFQFRMLFLE